MQLIFTNIFQKSTVYVFDISPYFSGGTGIYLRIVFIIGLLAVLAHAIFHIVLKAIATEDKPYGHMFPNCKYSKV